jgi:hypothetical protein
MKRRWFAITLNKKAGLLFALTDKRKTCAIVRRFLHTKMSIPYSKIILKEKKHA